MDKEQCERLKELFGRKGHTIASAASELGVSYSGLSAVLNGVTAPSTSMMARLSERFGVSPAWVMTGCGEMEGGGAVNVSEQLRRLMEERSLTGYRVSQMTGVSPSMISLILDGKRPLSARDLGRLSSGLGVSPYWLLTGEGDMEEAPQPPAGVERLREEYEEEMTRLREENARLRSELEKERERMRHLIDFAGSLLK